MKAVFSVLGLVLVLAVIGLIARKQLGSLTAPVPSSAGAAAVQGTASDTAPASPIQQPQQVQQAVQGIMLQARPMPEGEMPAK